MFKGDRSKLKAKTSKLPFLTGVSKSPPGSPNLVPTAAARRLGLPFKLPERNKSGQNQSLTPNDPQLPSSPRPATSPNAAPVVDRHKPLPSPPVAQFINPMSPPKARRSLMDAEAGTPSGEQYPALQPEASPLRMRGVEMSQPRNMRGEQSGNTTYLEAGESSKMAAAMSASNKSPHGIAELPTTWTPKGSATDSPAPRPKHRPIILPSPQSVAKYCAYPIASTGSDQSAISRPSSRTQVSTAPAVPVYTTSYAAPSQAIPEDSILRFTHSPDASTPPRQRLNDEGPESRPRRLSSQLSDRTGAGTTLVVSNDADSLIHGLDVNDGHKSSKHKLGFRSLLKRMRSTPNLKGGAVKPDVPVPPLPRPAQFQNTGKGKERAESVGEIEERPLIISSLDALLSRIEDTPLLSDERARGVKIVQTVLNAMENVRAAKVAAERAQEHARLAQKALGRLEALVIDDCGADLLADIRHRVTIVADGLTLEDFEE
ncbi:hypothetical protein BU24DRAFT_460877 [Aaosphaeria arxii CBS 175.79]|uniref:Uncharacterized protein n=1 Tax=Aaosphaeria arxii CBS 175.79 TaxID=1450172 RepID=A0A6A5XX25_9PLEO|nr:uncharacterized protein BU24DRAFT_460877 [Aaosphaeria arxii CBS 175.79]KAF2017888.1 hypothetical protein BU24DRAFT_460877 [Aaosphaeria arxii CBS 175.79]